MTYLSGLFRTFLKLTKIFIADFILFSYSQSVEMTSLADFIADQ